MAAVGDSHRTSEQRFNLTWALPSKNISQKCIHLYKRLASVYSIV